MFRLCCLIISFLLCVNINAQAHEIQLKDEGTSQGYVSRLNYTGDGVACTKSGIQGNCVIAGGGTPGGNDTEVQFNDNGSFAGDTNHTWDKDNDILTLGGTLSKIVVVPSSDTSITAGGGITVTNVIQRVVGSGGAVDITANPQIAAGSDGQLVIIQGTNDTNTVKLDDGTGLALCGGVSMTLGNNDNISMMYDSGASEWLEWGGRCDLD